MKPFSAVISACFELYKKSFFCSDLRLFYEVSKQKIKTIIITRENSKIVKSRGKKIKVFKTYVGVLHKELVLDDICKKLSLTSNNIAYVGDDINDYEIMKRCGLACSPNNCIKKIKSISDYVCENNGGDGVLREVADLILLFHTN